MPETPRPGARDVRARFLSFFEEHGHRAVPSAPVFPQDDPTLLFTNAGMNQFKDVFLGTGKRDYSRAVDTQKCIRVSGKHNDLEEVGRDTYHHTFFEMLGNWSFGDYFKAEAIPWAWELLTKVWGLPKERLWVTVFGGDEKDGLPADEEAERLWRETTDVDPSHVLRFDRADNFWEMGDTGPCGPCSEIHIDRGGPGTDPRDGANPKIGVNAGNERFIELWNLVFMEFNRLDDGSLKPLPAKHVDTGMGFERILAVLQGVDSNYATDLFSPLFAVVGDVAGRPYGGSDSEADVAFRVIADHARAVTAAISDGALPSNVGRGYVLRRLIRRASRYGRQHLGLEDPFLHRVTGAVAETLGDAFPEMRERADHVDLIVREEEVAFGRTLGRGLVRFGELAGRVESHGERRLEGRESFELYATYGFPRDLVELMARERGLELDGKGWEAAEADHREASKTEGKFKQLLSAEELEGLPATTSTFHDAGERSVCVETDLLFARGGEPGVLVLAESPFYPEGGGQVGDAGVVEALDGTFRFAVSDARKLGDVVVLLGDDPAPEGDLPVRVCARVDAERRARTRRNHSATHLLHRALKEVLGDHVTQQGSYVGPDRLRFDFSHPRGVTPEELDRIEARVNANVFANATVTTTVEDLEAAKARGVVALFGEKYDERVRVVDVGGWSTELCGGTHVAAAGDIGPFVIVLERALQAGVRRIEALTGPAAVEEIQSQRRLLVGTARALKAAPEDVPERVADLQARLKEARKQKAAASKGDVGAALAKVAAGREDVGGIGVAVVDLPELDGKSLREVLDRAASQAPDQALVLFGRDGDKVPFAVVAAGRALAEGVDAGRVVKTLQPLLGGGGGGKPARAQGQGVNTDAVPQAVVAAREAVGALLSG